MYTSKTETRQRVNVHNTEQSLRVGENTVEGERKDTD